MGDDLDRVLPPERLGRYRVVERLGAGGMGEVLLAIRSGAAGFKKPVALKRILPQLSLLPALIDQMHREASLAAMLHHPNCVHVSELEEIDGELVMAMELLFGVSLHELAKRASDRGEALPLGAALRILADGARGLHAVHSLEGRGGEVLGVVHGDVSPQNLFVTNSGVTKLLDFGVSVALLSTELRETHEGLLKGKYPYMAPEQFDGGPVDARIDVWALAVTLWEVVTGRPLFARGSPVVTMESVQGQRIPPVRELRPDAPPALDELLRAALERDPSRRMSSTEALAEGLEAIGRGIGGAGHADVAELVDRYARKTVKRLKRLAYSLTQDARYLADEPEDEAEEATHAATTPDFDLAAYEDARAASDDPNEVITAPGGRRARGGGPAPDPFPDEATAPSAPPPSATSPDRAVGEPGRELPQLPSSDVDPLEDMATTIPRGDPGSRREHHGGAPEDPAGTATGEPPRRWIGLLALVLLLGIGASALGWLAVVLWAS